MHWKTLSGPVSSGRLLRLPTLSRAAPGDRVAAPTLDVSAAVAIASTRTASAISCATFAAALAALADFASSMAAIASSVALPPPIPLAACPSSMGAECANCPSAQRTYRDGRGRRRSRSRAARWR